MGPNVGGKLVNLKEQTRVDVGVIIMNDVTATMARIRKELKYDM